MVEMALAALVRKDDVGWGESGQTFRDRYTFLRLLVEDLDIPAQNYKCDTDSITRMQTHVARFILELCHENENKKTHRLDIRNVFLARKFPT